MTNSESSSDTTDYSNYVMYLRTVQSSAIRVLIEALKEILTDTNLEFDGTNIKVIAMDPSHTVLVHLKLDSDKFEKYYCPDKILLGINTLNLFKLIKRKNQVIDDIIRLNPDALITIDSPDFCLRVAKKIKQKTKNTENKNQIEIK